MRFAPAGIEPKDSAHNAIRLARLVVDRDQMIAETKANAAAAVAERDLAKLNLALQTALELGIDEDAAFDAPKEAQKVLEHEAELCKARVETPIPTHLSAFFPPLFRSLTSLLCCAIAALLSPLLSSLLLRQGLVAAMSTLKMTCKSKGGVKAKDIAPLEAAIANVKGEGVPGDNKDVQDAGALVGRANEQIKVQAALVAAAALAKKAITAQLTGGEQLQARPTTTRHTTSEPPHSPCSFFAIAASILYHLTPIVVIRTIYLSFFPP